MNILVTGANGFIGKYIVRTLQKNHRVYRLSNGEIYGHIHDKFVVDLLNDRHIDAFLKEHLDIDIIIHSASKLASSDNSKDFSLLEDNIEMYENLVRIIDKFKPEKVINFSSIAVYPNKDGNYFEESEIRPSVNNEGLYGLSKFCGENMLDFMYKKINIIHLRIAQVYGEGMREDRIISIMKKELTETNIITVWGNGKRVSGFINIDMVIEKVVYFVENDVSGIFNISGENLSYKDLALRIIEKYGNNDSEIKLLDTGLTSKCFINTDKLKKIEYKMTKEQTNEYL